MAETADDLSAPLEPSMMVTVFCSAEPACLGADFVTGSEVLGGEVASFSPAGVA